MTPEQVVSQDVYYCVSSLITELAKLEQYQDDLSPILATQDWQTPAREGIEDLPPEGIEDLAGYYDVAPTKEAIITHLEDQDDWQECCDYLRLDSDTVEAYEHWIVSDWLARELEALGEMVTYDFLGLTIWGRATTGQQISADYVIEKIAGSQQ